MKKLLGVVAVLALAGGAAWYLHTAEPRGTRSETERGLEQARSSAKRSPSKAADRSNDSALNATDEASEQRDAADGPAHGESTFEQWAQPMLERDALRMTSTSQTDSADAPAADTKNTAGLQLTASETKVIAMYESMAVAFSHSSTDCGAMGRELERIVSDNAGAVAAMTREQARAGTAQAERANERIQAVAGPKIEKLREAIRSGIAHCPNEERVMAALRQLAEMQAAADGR